MSSNIREFYVHKDELDEEKIKLLYKWCLEAGASKGENESAWNSYFNDDYYTVYGVHAGYLRSYPKSIAEDEVDKIIPFSEVLSHLGLVPLREDTSSTCTTSTIKYVSAGLTSPVEMMQRLMDGEVFYWKDDEDEEYWEKYYNEGEAYLYESSIGVRDNLLNWSIFSELLIKKETLWYENIDPKNPPLCKVWDAGELWEDNLRMAFIYSRDTVYRGLDLPWDNATPTGKFKKDFM